MAKVGSAALLKRKGTGKRAKARRRLPREESSSPGPSSDPVAAFALELLGGPEEVRRRYALEQLHQVDPSTTLGELFNQAEDGDWDVGLHRCTLAELLGAVNGDAPLPALADAPALPRAPKKGARRKPAKRKQKKATSRESVRAAAQELRDSVQAYVMESPGDSAREIAEAISEPLNRVRSALKVLLGSGVLRRDGTLQNSTYHPAE